METWCKLGEIYFNLVEEEVINFENEITDKPLEDGSTATDHIQNKPITINISGSIFHRKILPSEHINALRDIWKNKEVVTYIGMENWGNVVVTNFKNAYTGELRNGIDFEMTLQQIQVTNKTYTNINTGGFTIPNIEKMKEQIQDAKQDRKDSRREARQAKKNANKPKKVQRVKAQTKVKKKTSRGRQAKKSKKTKMSTYQKIMSKY